MVVTALCVAVLVMALVSVAMLILVLRVGKDANDWEDAAKRWMQIAEREKLAMVAVLTGNASLTKRLDAQSAEAEAAKARNGTLEAELDSQTQAVVALCDAVGLTQDERMDIDLACERAEFHRNRTGDLCEIIRFLGAEDKPFGDVRAIVADLVDRKGKLDRYRAAIDAALGGVRRDGESWTNVHVPAIERLIAEHDRRGGLLEETRQALSDAQQLVDGYRSQLAGIDAALGVTEGGFALDAIENLQARVIPPAFGDEASRGLAIVSEMLGCVDYTQILPTLRHTIADASKYREFASTIKAAQEKAQAVITKHAEPPTAYETVREMQ